MVDKIIKFITLAKFFRKDQALISLVTEMCGSRLSATLSLSSARLCKTGLVANTQPIFEKNCVAIYAVGSKTDSGVESIGYIKSDRS